MNRLKGTLCYLRFGSGRTETFLAGATCQPLRSAVTPWRRSLPPSGTATYMTAIPNLYGETASRDVVDDYVAILDSGERLLRYEEARCVPILR